MNVWSAVLAGVVLAASRAGGASVSSATSGSDGVLPGEYFRANTLLEQCRFDEAERLLAGLSDSQRTDGDVALLHGRVLLQLGRPQEALQAVEPVTKRPRSGSVLFLRALARANLRELDVALKLLDGAQKDGVEEELVLGARGLAYLVRGQLPQAEKELLAALRLDPRLTGALYNLAVVRTRQGRLAEAGALIRAAWTYGYGNVFRLRADSDLAAVRASGLVEDVLAPQLPSCKTY